MVKYTLDQLTEKLDPQRFFRVNRKFLISYDAVAGVVSYSNSRLKVNLHAPPDDQPIIRSREKVNDFKSWLDM